MRAVIEFVSCGPLSPKARCNRCLGADFRGLGSPHRTRKEVVGAAGFEPATCSTQNCRATRLRYTPPGAPLDTCFAALQQGVKPFWRQAGDRANPAEFSSLMPAGKNRACDAVSR